MSYFFAFTYTDLNGYDGSFENFQMPNMAEALPRWSRIISESQRIERQCAELVDKAIADTKACGHFLDTQQAITVNKLMSSLGEPIAGVPFKGKLFPEGMPEEYREIDTLQFIQSLSGKHLRQWSNFYEIDIPEATTRAEEEAKLWKFLGGLPVGRGRAAGMEARKRSREDEEDDEDDEDYETERSAWKKRAIVPR